MSSTYAGMRDGRPVLLKRCEDCHQEKVVSPDKKVSEFHVRWRPLVGGGRSPGWGPTCIVCTRRIRREKYAQMSEEDKRRRAKEAWQKLLASPERHIAAKLLRQEWAAKRIATMPAEELEAWRQRRRDMTRRWSARKLEEDPNFYTRASRRERSRMAQQKVQGKGVVDLAQRREDPGPIREAIKGWLARNPEHDYALLSQRAGISERGIYRLVHGEHEHVTVDVADRIALAIDEPFSLIYPYEEAA